jgi:hypothetical protein
MIISSIKDLPRYFCNLLMCICILILFSGCASPTPQVIQVTVVVPQTVVVTEIIERVITNTPIPATETPIATATPAVTPTSEPIPTPEPSPTPDFIKWNSSNVVSKFKENGLEAEGLREMTRQDYGMAPLSAIEGTRFLIPSLCPDCGGRIFSFQNQEDLDLMKNYYEGLGRQSAFLFSWVFIKDNILVQINGDLSEERAREYENVLQDLG